MDSTLRSLRGKLERRFSPSRFLRRSDGLRPLSQGGAGSEWVLGRGLCAYAVFDCPPLPPGKRRAYVATAVRRWAPFADPQHHAEWLGQRAMVWAWSAQAVQAALIETGSVPPRRVIPESLLVGAPAESGAELLALEEGFEGRVWRAGALAASRWWPERPDLAEWNRFLRGAGLPAGASVASPVRPELAQETWVGAGRGAWGDLAQRYRSLAAAAALGLAALLFAMPLAGIVKLAWSNAQLRASIAAQDESLQNILGAREQAERDADRVAALLALRPPAGQIELLAIVIDLLPRGALVREWRMPSPDVLEVVLGQDRPDPRALVEAWQNTGRFQDVNADLGRSPNEITVRARILPAAGARQP